MHGVVEGFEEFVVGGLAFFRGEAERQDALDKDFFGVGLGAEDFYDFGDEVGEQRFEFFRVFALEEVGGAGGEGDWL